MEKTCRPYGPLKRLVANRFVRRSRKRDYGVKFAECRADCRDDPSRSNELRRHRKEKINKERTVRITHWTKLEDIPSLHTRREFGFPKP